MRLINNNTLDKLAFQELLNRVSPFSPYGKNLLAEISPYLKGQEEELSLEFKRLQKIQEYVKSNDISLIEHDLSAFKDIRTVLNNATKDYILDEVDCFEIKEHIFLMKSLQQKLDLPFQEFFMEPLDEAFKILDPNDENILSFHFYNAYSEELSQIRQQKKQLENSIFLEKVEQNKQELLLRRAEVIGLEEKAEYSVRCDITQRLRPYIEIILSNIQKLALLDFSLAKVRFFNRYDCNIPAISTVPLIKGSKMVNIRVKEVLENKKKTYTPIDIEVSSGTTVITGANMGGKSIALRTVVESILLFHYGFFVPCESASFPLLEFIHFISDDMQDFSKGISSFGAEILKLREIYPVINKRQGLIVFDEFARGTNPQEGQKFVKALVNYLNEFTSISIITSHFDNVVSEGIVHYQVVGLKNVNLEQLQRKIVAGYGSINMIQEYMDYRLEKTNNQFVPRDALYVAQLIGLDSKLEKFIQNEY